MSDDKRCVCHAQMAGECMCGAWDAAADDERAALLRRVEELEAVIAESAKDDVEPETWRVYRRMAARYMDERDTLREQVEALTADNASLEQHCDGLRGGQAHLREQVERLTRENEHLRGLIFDKDQLLQLHDLPRDGGPLIEHLAFERNRLRSQLSAVKAARDEACDLLDGLSDESIELEQRVRIAELRKVGD